MILALESAKGERKRKGEEKKNEKQSRKLTDRKGLGRSCIKKRRKEEERKNKD